MELVLAFGLIINLWNIRTIFHKVDYRPQAAYWENIGNVVGHDTSIIALTQDYGYPLEYFGWVSPAGYWPYTGDTSLREMAGLAQPEFLDRFKEMTRDRQYFLVTDLDELERQPQLKEALFNGYPIYSKSEGYIVFDLTQTVDPMSIKRISIVTPSYNQAPFLERTIRSVLDQDYPNIEYIIVDGGSTDGSLEIIKKYSHRLAWWTSEKDRGQTDAINKGFAHASGEIFAWLNSDDTYEPGSVRDAMQQLDVHPQCSAIYGEANFINENDRIIGRFPAAQTDLKKLKQGLCSCTATSLLFQGRLLAQGGSFGSRFLFCHGL